MTDEADELILMLMLMLMMMLIRHAHPVCGVFFCLLLRWVGRVGAESAKDKVKWPKGLQSS